MIMWSFDEVLLKTNIKAFVKTNDIVLGKKYNAEMIDFLAEDMKKEQDIIHYHFQVDSLYKNTYYDVKIFVLNRKEVKRVSCDCKDFRRAFSCEHVAAVFYNCYDMFFDNEYSNVLAISSDILEDFLPVDVGIKKRLHIVLSFSVDNYDNRFYYYNNYKRLNIKILIGDEKLYTLGNHTNAFKYAYESGDGEVYFGKNFTYRPNQYFVSDEDDVILRAYFRLTDGYYNRFYSSSEIKKFLSSIKDCKFVFNDYEIDGIIDGFGIDVSLLKSNELYELNFDLDSLETLINDDYEYILYKGKIYHLNKKEQNLLKVLFNNGMDKLIITKDKINDFTKGLLSSVKKSLVIDSSVDDLIIPSVINTEIYFDLKKDRIVASVKFLYDREAVNYFDAQTKVLRDMDFETQVINDILKYGFILSKNSLVLDDLELQVEFLEDGLEQLAEKYVIYTTEDFKKVSIKKKTTITSSFKIGTDNILSYDFNLGDINSDELVNIFKDMKNKKKYYRLRNGDILNLEDNSLKELNLMSEELELSDEEIIAGKGSVLKYRAIYLDSLKKGKYSIIKTDNLFDNFINNFYEYKNCELTLALDELQVLRDYQLVGVKWLKTLAKTGFGGILADEMGLGKTIQVIFYLKEILKEDSKSLFLIVVPTSLAYNWDHEFEVFAKDIKRLVCVGSKDKRVKCLKNLKENVIITTYGLLREDEELYERFNFHTMIIDEAQNIKNNMAGITKCVKRIKADTKFALTGTPLENTVLELWSIFDFIMPGYLSNLTKFQTKYRIKDFDEEGESLIKGLSHQINPFILRRKKVDVVKELPQKLVNDIYIDLDDEQKKLYVAELNRVKEEMEEIINDEGVSKARFLILQLLTKLRQICIDPSIVYDDYNYTSNKIMQLEVLVKDYIKNGHKILVFSSFKTALNIVKKVLNENKIKTYMIDGTVKAKARVDMVDDFNASDEVKVFLIMLKSGGTGLNLTSADVVIHLDLWWNPQAENQATDRAHRIGQVNTVEVIHLIMKGTIEEKILELQNKKRLLSDKLIDGEIRDKNILSDLTKEDIENLLSYENE